MTHREISIPGYTAPGGCSVSGDASFLGASLTRCGQLERWRDDPIAAWCDAVARQDLATLVVLALVRRRSPGDVANVLARCVERALAAGVGSRVEPALRARIDRALVLASCADVDGKFAGEVRDRFWGLRPATDLTRVLGELLDLVGRFARAGSGGAAERCADRLVSLIEGELGALVGRHVRGDLVALVDERLGARSATEAP